MDGAIMILQPLAAWIRASDLHRFMADNPIAFTACETLHFMGLTILFGALMVIDLRGMGLFKRLSLLEVHKLVPFAIGAFLVNLVTGIMFIFSNPYAYFDNKAFGLKMLLVLLAGLNALLFEVKVHRPLAAGNLAVETGTLVKVSSALSLAFWAGVLIFGRLIPYL
jgi:hypothetical protein